MLLILCVENKTLHYLITICYFSLHLSDSCLLFVDFVKILVVLLFHFLKLIV